jgi:hypothetical protein
MHRLDWRTMALSVGLFAAVMFASCVVYGLVVPSRLHAARVLEVILPGFCWLSIENLALGLGETFLYGAYAGLVAALESALGKQTGAEVIYDEDPARLVERLSARYVTSDYVCPCRPSAAV